MFLSSRRILNTAKLKLSPRTKAVSNTGGNPFVALHGPLLLSQDARRRLFSGARVHVRGDEMALPRLLILELLLYASCFICGIVTAASVIIVQGEFAGRCMLYGTVSYNATAQSLGVDSSSPTSLCFFVTVISVFMGVYCFSLTLYWIYTSCMGEEVSRGRVWMNVSLVVCGIFLFFLLVSGCILKIGRDRLCDSILRNATIKSCEDAQTKSWISPYHGERFYSGLHSAEGAVWVNFFFWMLIFMVVMFQKYQGSEFTIEEGEHVSPSESNPILGRTSRHQ